jgi:hypothetical protein
MRLNQTSIIPRECCLVYCKVNDELCIKILKKLIKNKTSLEIDHLSLRKMLQIISLIYKYFGATNEYQYLFNAIKDYLSKA